MPMQDNMAIRAVPHSLGGQLDDYIPRCEKERLRTTITQPQFRAVDVAPAAR